MSQKIVGTNMSFSFPFTVFSYFWKSYEKSNYIFKMHKVSNSFMRSLSEIFRHNKFVIVSLLCLQQLPFNWVLRIQKELKFLRSFLVDMQTSVTSLICIASCCYFLRYQFLRFTLTSFCRKYSSKLSYYQARMKWRVAPNNIEDNSFILHEDNSATSRVSIRCIHLYCFKNQSHQSATDSYFLIIQRKLQVVSISHF